MFQTDSDEDVIFVCEKSALKSTEITVDQEKLLALQRDIDLESLPKQLANTLKSQVSVAVEELKMKTEKEKSEENPTKKEKKRKKELTSPPKNINCEKKKKKYKKEETVVIEDQSLDECSVKAEKKKKKKMRIVNESIDGVTDGNDGVSNKKKKNKKKLLADHEIQVEADKSLDEEEERKKYKVKNKSVKIKPENVKVEKEENIGQDGKNTVQPKAKQGKTNILVVNKEEAEEKVGYKKKETTVTGIRVTKKKAKVAEIGGETAEDKTDEGDEVKVKKKQNVKIKDERDVETTEIKSSHKISKTQSGQKAKSEKMLKKKKNKSAKTEIVTVEDEKRALKRKVKKDKDRKTSLEVSEVEVTEPKKKKTKGEEEETLSKKVKEEAEKDERGKETLVATNKKNRRKKSSTQMEQMAVDNGVRGGAKKKKKKIKEEQVEEPQESPHVDVVFLSEKSGNTDEITINQERRQALQMEIDEASQPEKTTKQSGFGQWSTAQFSSSEQQQKFLRLMGGFKKGFQPAAMSTGKTNMALGKEAQQQLQQGLLGQFERAHSRRTDFNSKGAGLGFAAPSNKKFSIDINASRSIRFDD